MSFLQALRLKLLDLLSRRSLVFLLFVLPPLMGMTAGAANRANRSPDIRIALADLDGTPESRELAGSLKGRGWDILEAERETLPRLLDGRLVDGALVIEQGYAGALGSLQGGGLTFTPAEGTLTANLVLDVVSAAMVPQKSRLVFFRQLEAHYTRQGLEPPADLRERFDAAVSTYAGREARLDFVFDGERQPAVLLSYIVADDSMEVLFLGVYALLGSLILSPPGLRRRLAATRRGLALDYLSGVAALLLAGAAQILLYLLAVRGLTRAPLRLAEPGTLAAFLLMSLALGQLMALLSEGLRLYLGLLATLLLSVAGGCFFRLSGPLIAGFSQYLPQGWALAALAGYPVLPAVWPVLISLALLLIGYAAFARSAGRPAAGR